MFQYLPLDQSPIEGFFIYYRPYSEHNPALFEKETLMGSELRRHIIRALRPNTQYSIKITCFNGAGESEDSNEVVKKTLGTFQQQLQGAPLTSDWLCFLACWKMLALSLLCADLKLAKVPLFSQV